jgi:glycosyltransferase involved in cell wall biosynthesis
MKILYATHFYPPAACGGAGYYTASLAEHFRSAGHETRVICAGRWQEGHLHYAGYTDDVRHDVPIRRIHQNWRLAPKPFDYLYDNPDLDDVIRGYLAEYCPDIVHITSCYTLSARIINTVKTAGIPVVLHLVDYWFICPRHTLLRKDGNVCFGGNDAWECQQCLLYGTKVYNLTARFLPDKAKNRLFTRLGKWPVATRQPSLIGTLGDMSRRRRTVVDATCAADRILAPSKALLDLYARNGVVGPHVRFVAYGHESDWASEVHRLPSSELRLGFLGNIIPIKGVHVLLEAFKHLQGSQGLRLDVYGDDTIDVDYTSRLKADLSPNVYWHGRYSREDLAKILSTVDVLVVPSMWHENNPLVIQEGFAAGCPAVVSDVGGMTDVVTDEVNGLHFRRGDSAQLAQKIERLSQDSGLLAHLRANIPNVKTMADETDELGEIYAELIRQQPESPR